MAMDKASMRIDAHQHFWRYTEEEFGWISDDMGVIRRDFLPADLVPLLDHAGMDGTVAVQARQSLEETDWLLELAAANDRIAGVVGWIPLIDARVEETLDRLAANSHLKGVRHVLQGEADEYMAREDFNAGMALLRRYPLTYDLLVLEHQLPAAIALVDRHPNQVFVLDHLAKPLIKAQQLDPWRTHLRELARRPHVSCKISGMVTEADLNAWRKDDMRPYVEAAVEAFGPERLLFGSDWPVCTVASSYTRWVSTVQELTDQLSSAEQALILGGNAVRLYRLSHHSNSREVA